MGEYVNFRFHSLALVLLISLTAAANGTVNPLLFQDLKWRSIGPFRGGRVLAVAGISSEPLHFYFGAVNGGVWETRDAGRTWSPIFDRMGAGSIGAIAVAPSNARILYVGTGEADMRSDIAQGIGMFRSDDGGTQWRSIGLADTQQIGQVIVDPRNPDVVLVAALGHPYGANAERGVFRSTDGGRHWTKTLYSDADTGAIDIVFRPRSPDVVYAALWQTRRPPWNVYAPSSGPGSGLYKSIDNGRSWTKIHDSALPQLPGRIGLAVAQSDPSRLYALIDARDGGLFRSADDGAHWTRTTSDSRIWNRGWYFSGITVNPRNAEEIYVCNTVVLRSIDGGRHFVPVKGDQTGDDFHSLWIDPADPDRRMLGSDQGAQVTLNGGATWSSWYNQPTGQFYHVITDNRFPYWVYGAQQDSGAAGVPSRTHSVDGIAMPQFHEITAGGESDNIAPDPADPEIIYGGRVERLDLRTDQTRNVDPTLAFPDRYRRTWTFPLVFGPRDHALYFANQRIFRTSDGGAQWQPISRDLTRADPGVPPNLDPATAADREFVGKRRGVVYTIAPSPLDARLIWAGTDDGLVWRTADGGATWQDVTPRNLAPWSKVSTIEASHFAAGTAYIAVDRHRLDDSTPYLYRTNDAGKTWTLISSGVAQGGALNSVNVVREDPQQRALLFAGTERGVFVSFDDGHSWQPLDNGLPPTSVRDIDVHGDDLVIATHGRGFYILDDVAPLRSLALDASVGVRLFPPAAAYRFRTSAFEGTPMPKDEPMAPNPPDGAALDYVVPANLRGAVELTITDASGAPVRNYSSTSKTPPVSPSKLAIAPEWMAKPLPLRTSPGHHRFVWDLHYDAAKGLYDTARSMSGEEQEAKGVWAPPGHYTILLKVGGQSFRQSLEVLPDPRVKGRSADYAREFALAKEIEMARVEVRKALRDAERLHGMLVKGETGGSIARRAVLTGLDRELMRIAGMVADEPRWASPEPEHAWGTLHDISGDFDSLASAVDGADGAPSPDAENGYREREKPLLVGLNEWKALSGRIDAALHAR
ncbi:MAG TPA: hypothetical protein VHT03_03340 [Rhizomicrobium sp.]|jgi:photosystem II stability/assembly factor-like uncharacterized protein|nr:hypothetical protein [Rhizomicrobium sp.]